MQRKTVNVPEEQRNTVQVKLRLEPEVAWELRSLAAHWRESISDTVTRLLENARASR